jgi:hypothetical protein
MKRKIVTKTLLAVVVTAGGIKGLLAVVAATVVAIQWS